MRRSSIIGALLVMLIALPQARAQQSIGGGLPQINSLTGFPLTIPHGGTNATTTAAARDNIVANPGSTSFRTPGDFGAKCDVLTYSGSATWAAGGTAFTPNSSITPASSHI